MEVWARETLVIPLGAIIVLLAAPLAAIAGWLFSRRGGWPAAALLVPLAAVAILVPSVVTWAALLLLLALGLSFGKLSPK